MNDEQSHEYLKVKSDILSRRLKRSSLKGLVVTKKKIPCKVLQTSTKTTVSFLYGDRKPPISHPYAGLKDIVYPVEEMGVVSKWIECYRNHDSDALELGLRYES